MGHTKKILKEKKKFQIILRFPGLTASDDVLSVMRLMMSKSPDTAIAANVALDGGFNPCDNSSGLTSRKKRAAVTGCDPGRVPKMYNK
jgi:hypothetical protein